MKINRLLICCAVFILGCVSAANAQTKIIETIAGNGTGSFAGDNGVALSSQVNIPYMICVDGSNNLYIADAGNNRVRKINATNNIITTVAGTSGVGGYTGEGGATSVKLNNPIGVAVDAGGNFLYIGDNANNRIRKVDLAANTISSLAGITTAGFSGDGFAAITAAISGPKGVAVDGSGNVYFADAGNNRIRMINALSGIISTIAGNGTPGYVTDGVVATTTQINNPCGVYVDAAGNVYFADAGNNRIRKIDVGTLIISTVAGNGTAGYAGDGSPATAAGCRINAPTAVTFDAAGNMYISDAGSNRIRYVDKLTGNISTIVSSSGFGFFSGDGGVPLSATIKTATPAPTIGASVAVGNNNSYYISDRNNNRIRQVRDNFTPVYTTGGIQTMTVCQNAAATSINAKLATTDTDRNQTLTWSLVSVQHGAIGGLAGTSATTGGSVTPTGKTYQPTAGYSGPDTFIIKVSDGFASSNDTVAVTVSPLPVVSPITGTATVCEGANATLADATLSDATNSVAWTAQNAKATVNSAGVVHGVTAGTDVITYTVTNSCGTIFTTTVVTINPLPVAGAITGAPFVCMGSTTNLTDAAPGGAWSSGGTLTSVSAGGVVTPIAPGTDNITYSVTNGCGTTSTVYPINVIAIPFAGTITGTATAVCAGGGTISLTDATTGGGWSEVSGNASVSSSGVVTGVTAGTDVITYTFTNLCGSAATTYAVTVSPLPTAGTITAATNNVCIAGTLTLSDAITGGTWANTTGKASVSGTGVVTGVTAGNDVIVYTVTNSCGSAATNFSVTVVSTPSAGTITGPATSVCVSSTVALSDVVSGGAWSVTTGKASVSSSGVVTGVSAGTEVISYTVSFSCGTASAVYNMTVNPLADAGAISGPSIVCLGSSISLSDPITLGAWSSSNTGVATVSGGVVTSVAGGITNILYSVSNICGTTSATKAVTVSPYVTPSITFMASPGFTSCAGNMVTYTPLPVNGGSTPAYVWNVNGTPISTGAPFNYTPNNGDTILVTMTSSAACLTTTMASRSNKVVVNPVVVPAISISTGVYTDTVCTGLLTEFTATTVNGGTTPSYQWSINGVVAGGGNPFSYYPSNGDVITCDLTSGNVCAVPATATSNAVTMTVDPISSEVPKVDIFASPGSTVCNGTEVTFIAKTLYGGIKPFLRWTKNGVNVATGPTYHYTGVNTDVVHVMLLSSSGCLLSSIYDSVFSPDITLTVVTETPPKVTISIPNTVVSKGATTTLTAAVSHPTATLTYQWFVNGVAITGATSKTFDFSQADAGTSIVNCVVNSGDICNTTSISNLINLTISALNIGQTESASVISLVPNPNNGSFTIEGTVSEAVREVSLRVTDVVGRVVYNGTALAQNGALKAQVSIGNQLANGVYLLHITSGDENKVIRFTVSK